MDKRNIQGDPGQPEERAATSVHGEGDDDGSATGRSPSPLATEILASDLQKLMDVVMAAVGLYNAWSSDSDPDSAPMGEAHGCVSMLSPTPSTPWDSTMSDHDEVMERLNWLVTAVKHLLGPGSRLSA